MELFKPSNSQLADEVSRLACKMLQEKRGVALSISEQVDIGNAVYGAFNSATVRAESEARV